MHGKWSLINLFERLITQKKAQTLLIFLLLGCFCRKPKQYFLLGKVSKSPIYLLLNYQEAGDKEETILLNVIWDL